MLICFVFFSSIPLQDSMKPWNGDWNLRKIITPNNRVFKIQNFFLLSKLFWASQYDRFPKSIVVLVVSKNIFSTPSFYFQIR